MSSIALKAAFACKTMSYRERLVLLALAHHHKKSSWRCSPKVKEILADAQVSRATYLRCAASLEEQGLVKIIPHYDKWGRMTPAEFVLLFIGDAPGARRMKVRRASSDQLDLEDAIASRPSW